LTWRGHHRHQGFRQKLIREEIAVDIVKLAEDSGLLVVLDGKIGKTEYRSVQGSLAALERFADAISKYADTPELATSESD
jgi:hypothetical protein